MPEYSTEDYALAAEALREKAGREEGGAAERAAGLALKFEQASGGGKTPPPPAAGAPPNFAGHRLSRLLLQATIGALILAALIAIGGLLSGGFSEGEARVLLAVVSTWVFTVAFLAGVRGAARGGAVRVVGIAAQVLAGVAMAFSLALIVAWDSTRDEIDRGFWALAILSLASAHASYLLGTRLRADATVRLVVGGTLAALIVLAALLLALTVGFADDVGGGYWRAVAVVAVLLALGDLILPVLERLRRLPG